MLKRVDFNGNMTVGAGGVCQLVSELGFDWVNKCFFNQTPTNIPIFRPSKNMKRIKKLDIMTHNKSTDGVILNLKVYNVLKQFRLPAHKIIPIQIYDVEGNLWDDYIFLVIESVLIERLDLVNLKECNFNLLTKVMEFIKKLQFDNIDDYFSILPEIELQHQRIKCKKIVFKKDTTPEYDFFRLGGIFYGLDFYCSEALGKELKKNKITGYKLIDTTDYHPVDPVVIWEE